MLTLATTRTDIANYVGALFTVYIVLLFVYLLVNLMLSFGVRPPYSRWTDAVLGFLRDVSEPYLRIFRRLLPTMGGFDFTPMLAIIVLYILRRIVTGAIA
ncbi:MAG: YggT family protein [Solirubrobacteraceae bacterium]